MEEAFRSETHSVPSDRHDDQADALGINGRLLTHRSLPVRSFTQLHLPLDQAFLGQSIGLACMVVLIPIFGVLSDLVGRKPIMIVALVLDFVMTYPLFAG